MDLKKETRTFVLVGCGVALVCAIPLGFVIGIGGALVCAVVGIAATCIACALRNRVAKSAQQSLKGHTQIQGILDSSQLDADEPAAQEILPFARRGKLIAAVISLAFCLASGAVVGVATRGTGINFYLGNTPQSSTNKKASSSSSSATTSKNTSGDSQDWSEDYDSGYDVVETWYPPEEETTQSTVIEQEQPSNVSSSASSADSNPVDSSATAPSEPANDQSATSTPAPSAPANEQPVATQTPTNSGTIDNATQSVQEQ